MLSALLSRPRRIIATLVLMLAATGVAIGSGATFTSQTASAANTFTSGTLLQSNTKDGTSIVTGSNLKPGDTQSGEVTIKNTGTLSGDFVMNEKSATNNFAAGSLTLKVDDVTSSTSPVSVYSGDLAGLVKKNLGTVAAGASRTYRFTVTLSSSASNADQGKTATAAYTWDATPTAS